MTHLYERGGGGWLGGGMFLCSGSSGISIDFGFEVQAPFVSGALCFQTSSNVFNVSARRYRLRV